MNEQVSIDVFAKITAHNNQLIKEMESPDFDGDTKLDPTRNNGEKYIHAANEVVVSYPQGNFPLDIARNAVETTLQLLMICEMKYGKDIVKPMSQKFRRLLNLWYYNGEPTHSPEIFAREIHEAEDTLFTVMENANCKMPAAPFCAQRATDDKLPPAAPPLRQKRRGRKGSGLKGKRTAAMEQWLQKFTNFVNAGHAINEAYKSKTVGAIAAMFWRLNKISLEAAARATGESHGFSSAKTLASAFRNS